MHDDDADDANDDEEDVHHVQGGADGLYRFICD